MHTMKLDASFFRSRFGRRIFVLFACCALIPILALSLLSLRQVAEELSEQSRERLKQLSKAEGMAIYERLLLLEAEMHMVASTFGTRTETPFQRANDSRPEPLKRHFTAMTFFPKVGSSVDVFGGVEAPPESFLREWKRLSSGKTALWTETRSTLPGRVFMIKPLNSRDPNEGFLAAEIDTAYLWDMGAESTLPPMTEICVLDQSKNLLASSIPTSETLLAELRVKMDRPNSGQISWRHGGEEFISSYWDIFMASGFFSPNWTILLSQSRSYVLAPMSDFKMIFTLVVMATFFVILLLSMIHIRRNLAPLNTLKQGTRLVAAGDYSTRVNITSRDEFEDLATSFNTMTNKIEKQFTLLSKMTEIDRAILSSLDTVKIIDTVISASDDLLSCNVIAVCMIDSKQTNLTHIYMRSDSAKEETQITSVSITQAELQQLINIREYSLIQMDADVPSYLAGFATSGIRAFLVMPVYRKEKLLGTINMGYISLESRLDEDIDHARRLVHQIAIALSNSKLIQELDELNWGTIEALARTVDAKSPWTAGHSQRVTNSALEIAGALGFSKPEMQALHRAALLHDIGKIGIPASILDKPAKLDVEEYRLIKEHPHMGVRILEPVSAYSEILPLVLQHHERFDGQGYPNGLSGDAITLGARIIAVADVYDALVSDRPYRSGWTAQQAVELIRQEAGRQFDPLVVKVFLKVLAQKKAVLARATNKGVVTLSAEETSSGSCSCPPVFGQSDQINVDGLRFRISETGSWCRTNESSAAPPDFCHKPHLKPDTCPRQNARLHISSRRRT
jgi:putative nucleotidyltransferase with HDIG domain